MGKQRVPDLYRAPFPLYSVKIDPKTGLIIAAGGGGASKTGIKNAVVSVCIKQCVVAENNYLFIILLVFSFLFFKCLLKGLLALISSPQ